MVGTFERYTDEAHRGIVDAFPELKGTIIRSTYEEAEDAAFAKVTQLIRDLKVANPIVFVHHPHREESQGDPLEHIGSWGWKVAV